MAKLKGTTRRATRAGELLTSWAPALLWMAAIFYFSSQNTWTTVDGPPLFKAVRKSAHVVEFGVLAILVGQALLGTWVARGERLSRSLLLKCWQIGVVLCTLYAISDELHQALVPRREFHLTDILIDGLSATAALGIWYIVRARKRVVTLSPEAQ